MSTVNYKTKITLHVYLVLLGLIGENPRVFCIEASILSNVTVNQFRNRNFVDGIYCSNVHDSSH